MTAVVVHWGPVEPTVRLVERLAEMRRLTAIVVVANDATARPPELPAGVVWLVPKTNLGFAGGFHHGADSRPASDVYLLLNNDVRLPEDTLEACLDLLARDGVGIVGPTLLNAAGIHPGPARLTRLFAVPHRRRAARPGEVAEVAFVRGAILLIRAECHRRVPMDTRFFLGYDEADLAWRARAAGWRVLVSPYQAWHAGGGTIPGNTSAYYSARNRIWFARVHGGRRRGAAVALWLALVTVPRSVGSDLLRARGVARCRFAWHGLVDGLGPLPPAGRPFADEPRPRRWERAARAARRARETPTDSAVATYARTADLVDELQRIKAVAGPAAAAWFAVAVTAHAPTVTRTRRLDAADRAMAIRDWTFRPQPGVRVRLPGTAFADARQVYCRHVYTARAGFAPAGGETVVDLGAGEGLFSLLAAAAGARRVVAVEPVARLGARLAAHARANGLDGRVELVHARVVAGDAPLGDAPAAESRATGRWPGAGLELTVAELLDRHELSQVDLLRIDLDGAELALFTRPGWLGRVRRIVLRLSPEHGDPAWLQRVLTDHGFDTVLLDHDLAATPTLVGPPAGYLYAQRGVRTPRPRRESRPGTDARACGSPA